jgi:hypothetical protein
VNGKPIVLLLPRSAEICHIFSVTLGGPMAMKSDIEPSGAFQALIARTAHVRIAIPSWRWSVIDLRTDQRQPQTLSREEIVSLFEGELGRKRRRPQLTEREESDKAQAGSIRRALYPS